jgi:hypothetical protein
VSSGSSSTRSAKLASIRPSSPGVRHCEAAREARVVERARKLDQGEWVAARLGDDPVAHRLIQNAEFVRLEDCTGALVRQVPEAQLG